MVLTDDLAQRLGPEPVCKGARGLGGEARRLEEIAHGLRVATSRPEAH
jgi:hypothetical protein